MPACYGIGDVPAGASPELELPPMPTLRTFAHDRIATKGPDGQPNGFLVPIYSVHDGFLPEGREPKQVYLTVCSRGARKGPHLHYHRWGYFTCVRGNVRIVARVAGQYVSAHTGEAYAFQTVEVPAGVPAMIENVGDEDAYVINTPSPAWRPDEPDEHPVDDWNP
jgi:mannose-6-phosphate isomerase-like protein (cupin superfamily)